MLYMHVKNYIDSRALFLLSPRAPKILGPGLVKSCNYTKQTKITQGPVHLLGELRSAPECHPTVVIVSHAQHTKVARAYEA
jgi:hypothetical protein